MSSPLQVELTSINSTSAPTIRLQFSQQGDVDIYISNHNDFTNIKHLSELNILEAAKIMGQALMLVACNPGVGVMKIDDGYVFDLSVMSKSTLFLTAIQTMIRSIPISNQLTTQLQEGLPIIRISKTNFDVRIGTVHNGVEQRITHASQLTHQDLSQHMSKALFALTSDFEVGIGMIGCEIFFDVSVIMNQHDIRDIMLLHR